VRRGPPTRSKIPANKHVLRLGRNCERVAITAVPQLLKPWCLESARVIWLLRHGDAADGTPDAERPLTAKGEEQARNAGLALRRLDVLIDACIASPKVRARDTARLACEAFDGGLEVSIEEALQGGPFDPRHVAAGLENVLLVGHDPDFSMAVHSLTGAQVRMKKGGLAGIAKGELLVLLRPAELAAIVE
jgi:phosphohistidine phosphatase